MNKATKAATTEPEPELAVQDFCAGTGVGTPPFAVLVGALRYCNIDRSVAAGCTRVRLRPLPARRLT